MAGLCVVAALISAVFVSDAQRDAAPSMAPPAPDPGSSTPVSEALVS
jgi:hypothetical protein